MADYKFKNSQPLKGGNYWQNYVSGIDLRSSINIQDKKINTRDVIESLYRMVGVNPTFKKGKFGLDVGKKGRFDIPLSKRGHSVYGNYKHKRGTGSKIKDYDFKVGVRFPIDF